MSQQTLQTTWNSNTSCSARPLRLALQQGDGETVGQAGRRESRGRTTSRFTCCHPQSQGRGPQVRPKRSEAPEQMETCSWAERG